MIDSRPLLIHGCACDSRFWAPQMEALTAAGMRPLAPDLPHHGGPTGGVEPSLQALAGWLVDTHLREPAVLIGHSLGGMIALEIVRDHSDVVAGIVLVDSFPCLALNAAHLPGMFVDAQHQTVRKWVEETRLDIVEVMTQAVYDELWPSIRDFDATGRLGAVSCPVLGIYGGRGLYAPADASRLKHDLRLDEIGGKVEVSVVPDAGHFVNLEASDAVNAILLGWLRGLGS